MLDEATYPWEKHALMSERFLVQSSADSNKWAFWTLFIFFSALVQTVFSNSLFSNCYEKGLTVITHTFGSWLPFSGLNCRSKSGKKVQRHPYFSAWFDVTPKYKGGHLNWFCDWLTNVVFYVDNSRQQITIVDLDGRWSPMMNPLENRMLNFPSPPAF